MEPHLVPENRGVIFYSASPPELTVLHSQLTVWERHVKIVNGEVEITHSRSWVTCGITSVDIRRGVLVIEINEHPAVTGLLPWLDETLRVLRLNKERSKQGLNSWQLPPDAKPQSAHQHQLLPLFPSKPA